jgi:hypothetical protein
MHAERPLKITALIILIALGGGIILLMGLDRWSFGANGLSTISPSYPSIDQAMTYYRAHSFTGVLWIFGGLGFLAAAYGLWNFEEWGIKAGLYSGAAIVLGWLIIEYFAITASGYPAPIGGLFIGLSIFLLQTDQVRDYLRS